MLQIFKDILVLLLFIVFVIMLPCSIIIILASVCVLYYFSAISIYGITLKGGVVFIEFMSLASVKSGCVNRGSCNSRITM